MPGSGLHWLLCVTAALVFGALAQSPAHAGREDRQLCLMRPQFSEILAKACTQVIEASGSSVLERAVAHNNRALCVSVEDAMRDFDEAVRLAPGIAKIRHNRGVHLMHDQPERALADFDEAVRLDPRFAVAWTSRGETYALLKQYDRAIADFDRAIQLAPGFMHPMYNPYEDRARAKDANGDREGAAADRKAYQPLWMRTSGGSVDVRGPNAKGARAWEPLITLSDVARTRMGR